MMQSESKRDYDGLTPEGATYLRIFNALYAKWFSQGQKLDSDDQIKLNEAIVHLTESGFFQPDDKDVQIASQAITDSDILYGDKSNSMNSIDDMGAEDPMFNMFNNESNPVQNNSITQNFDDFNLDEADPVPYPSQIMSEHTDYLRERGL